MHPSPELINAIYADKVRRARRTPIEKKLASGPMLFDFGCEAMRMGIRAQHPGASDQEVEAFLRQRLAIGARLEKREWKPTSSSQP